MEIALMRHGQTDWNLAELVQGHTDVPLNDTGREQARATGISMAREADSSGASWGAVTSSPLARARETAEIVAGVLGVPMLDPVDELIEQDFGEAEGVSVSVLYSTWPDRVVPGAESDADVGARGAGALDRIAAGPGAGASPASDAGSRVLAVAHGSLIRATIAHLTGRSYLEVPRVPNASRSHFLRDTAAWRVLRAEDDPRR